MVSERSGRLQRVGGLTGAGQACARLVRLDLGAVSAPEVLVQHAVEGRLLRVHVDGRRLVLGKTVGVGAGEAHEVETRTEGNCLASRVRRKRTI